MGQLDTSGDGVGARQRRVLRRAARTLANTDRRQSSESRARKAAVPRSPTLKGRHDFLRELPRLGDRRRRRGGRVSWGGRKHRTAKRPTVFNAGFNIAQFWDGRAETLEDQIDGPIQNELEMASLWPDVVAKLEDDKEYPGVFASVYPGQGISRATIKNAIAEFERSLITPNSRFDRWLNGNEQALTRKEKEGYERFKYYGCASCHQGQNVGGNMFQVFGVLNDYFARRGNTTKADLGRFNVTGNPEDRNAFKVPSLRMAVHTAPYLHDGSAKTLRDAVDAMFEFQLGRTAPDSDKEAIVAFIKTLAGEIGGTNQ